MTWTCDQIEARLSDYIDGVLEGAERGEFAAHAESCAHCAPLFASVRSLVREMHAIEELEVPPRLVYAILDQTLGPREKVSSWQVFLSLIRGMATPKFAYGAASIFATLVILVSSLGFSTRNPKMADLRPSAIYRNADRKVHRMYANSIKYVSDLRVVYEIQSRLRQDENNLQAAPENVLPKAPGQTDQQKPAQPRQQNRADELSRHLELLASEFPFVSERSAR